MKIPFFETTACINDLPAALFAKPQPIGSVSCAADFLPDGVVLLYIMSCEMALRQQYVRPTLHAVMRGRCVRSFGRVGLSVQ